MTTTTDRSPHWCDLCGCDHRPRQDDPMMPVLSALVVGEGLEQAEPDESPEETIFRTIIECGLFELMSPEERDDLLVEISLKCLQYVHDRDRF